VHGGLTTGWFGFLQSCGAAGVPLAVKAVTGAAGAYAGSGMC